jgi:hypothetical protein
LTKSPKGKEEDKGIFEGKLLKEEGPKGGRDAASLQGQKRPNGT